MDSHILPQHRYDPETFVRLPRKERQEILDALKAEYARLLGQERQANAEQPFVKSVISWN